MGGNDLTINIVTCWEQYKRWRSSWRWEISIQLSWEIVWKATIYKYKDNEVLQAVVLALNKERQYIYISRKREYMQWSSS